MTPERDSATTITPVTVIAPAVYDADNTPAAIDLRDALSATIVLNVGVGGITFTATNKIEFVLTHSDDDSTYDNVTAADLVGDALMPLTITGGIVRSIKAAHASATVQKIGYIGGRRYVKLLADFGGTHATGTPIAATLIKGRLRFAGAA